MSFLIPFAPGNHINDGSRMIHSSMMAIMGRMSAQTGKQITWEEAMAAEDDLFENEGGMIWDQSYEPHDVPVPGVTTIPGNRWCRKRCESRNERAGAPSLAESVELSGLAELGTIPTNRHSPAIAVHTSEVFQLPLRRVAFCASPRKPTAYRNAPEFRFIDK